MPDIKSTLQGFKNSAEYLAALHKNAMEECQMLNMQGFKRWHRWNARKYYNMALCVMNYAQDCNVSLTEFPQTETYHVSSLRQHMETMIPKLEAEMRKIESYNWDMLQCIKIPFHDGVKLQECLFKNINKMKVRWYNRFTQTGWMAHDLFVFNDELHEKVKEKEKSISDNSY